MEKGLLFLTLSMFCLWALLDEFFGGQKLSSVAQKLTPGDTSTPIKWDNKEVAQEEKEKAKEKIDKDTKLNKDEKKFLKDNIDHFYGPGPA